MSKEIHKQDSTSSRSLESATIWSAVNRWISQLLSLGIFALMARYLDPLDFGLVAISMIYISFMDVIVDQGLSSALIQRRYLEEEHKSTAFLCCLFIGSFLALITFLSATWFARALGDIRSGIILQVLSLRLLLLPLTSVQQALLRKEMNFKALSIRSIISQIIGGILGVLLALNGFGAWSLVGQQLASIGSSTCLLWWMSPWKPSIRFSKSHFGDLYSFSIWVQVRNLLLFLSRNIETILIAGIFGSAVLGIYTVASRLMHQVLGAVSGLFGSVSFPYLSQVSDDLEEVGRRYLILVGVSSTLAFPVFSTLIVIADDIFQLLFGDRWSASVAVFQGLCVSGIILTVSYFFNGISLALGHPRWTVGILLVRTIAIALIVTTIRHLGLVAIAMGVASALLISLIIELVVIKNIAKLGYLRMLRIVIPPLIAAVVGAAGVLDISTVVDGEVDLFKIVVKLLVFFLGYLMIFRKISFDRYNQYKQYIFNKIRRSERGMC